MRRDSGSGGSAGFWLFRVDNTGKVQYADGGVSVTGATTLSTNTWYSALATRTNNSTAAKIYVNGQQDGTAAGTANSITNTYTLKIGAANLSFAVEFFAGQFEDVRLYNIAVPAAVAWGMYDPATRYNLYWKQTGKIFSFPITSTQFSVTNTLSLSQTVALNKSVQQTLSNTFALSQTSRGFNGTKINNQTITFNSIVAAAKVYNRTLTHTLIYNQNASVSQIRTSFNTIAFSQSVTVQQYKGANTALIFAQALTLQYNPHNERISQILTLTQSLSAGRALPRPASNTFAVTGTATVIRVRSFSVGNVIVFQNFGSTTKILKPNNSFVISQAVVQHRIINRAVGNLFQPVQTLVKTTIFNLAVNNQLLFKDWHNKITELVGKQQVIIYPTVIVTKPNYSVVLEASSAAITLLQPELGDTEGGLSKFLQQRTITGSLYTYVRRIGARKLKYKFEIPRIKALELRSYIYNYLSEPMRLTNWKGEIWFGFIVNNPFSQTSKARSLPCENEVYDVELEFEGVKIHG
jgi:hypothetical protein